MPSQPVSPPVVPGYRLSQEVRFAVVMYGGVSLAIYINGVAQELYRLVRATAPAPDSQAAPTALLASDQLQGTERVYRKLGQMLSRTQKPRMEVADGDPIRTRFVIDILSGTSAGGINAVYLAKALANDQPIEQLKQLWIDEGDISLLINDKQSVKNLAGLAQQDPPESLLNSQRMYLKLLNALDDMEKERPSDKTGQSPYVSELDLFITATDIQGVAVPLRLADSVVYERRYRNVFHFLYSAEHASGEARNDFHADYNPFLAFAARCTSAFPFAFTPMCLHDIDAVLATFPKYRNGDTTSASDRWKPFFENYLRPSGAPAVPIARRAFGDGGYLDNKPFSFATDALVRRQANVPVDRKLIYIEPSPQHPEEDIALDRTPDAIENIMAALLTLPRYETIREDLRRVIERNRLVEQVNRFIGGIEQDRQVYEDRVLKGNPPRPKGGLEWAEHDLLQMIEIYGAAYGGYHRLKVESVTDELAVLITRAVGFDEDSDQFLAIRYVVRAWRDNNYVDYYPTPGDISSNTDKKHTQNKFLLDFDLSYRIRRLNYVRSRIDLLCYLDDESEKVMKYSNTDFWPHGEQTSEFLQELLKIKSELNEASKGLRKARHTLWSRLDENPLLDRDLQRSITMDNLLGLLEQTTDDDRLAYAQALLKEQGRADKINKLANELATQLSTIMITASDRCKAILDPARPPDTPPRRSVRKTLWHYYEHYDNYDMTYFPILYSTAAGETDTVEIIRISPEDATSLIDERKESRKANGRRKLAGTALGNFGAFLEPVWRRNDILWGRLDGAERIITALLPGAECKEVRAELIEEAHALIITAELMTKDQDELCRLLAEALARTNSGAANERALRALVEPDLGSPINPKLQAVLRSCLDEKVLLRYFREGYEVNRHLNPKIALYSLSRSTQVIGKMLEGLADRHQIQGSRLAWVTRLGQIFWGLVIVAVPGSILNLVLRHWLKLLYTFEALLILLGTVLIMPEMQRLGLVALGITLAVNLAVALLGNYMRGRRGLLRMTVTLIVAVLLFFAVVGMDELFGWGLKDGFLQFTRRVGG